MDVLFLTVFLSLCLAGYFIFLFFKSQRQDSETCVESESLLPFAEEKSIAEQHLKRQTSTKDNK
ncbi:MAG TPA: hypothetical protein VJ946_09915 [Bacteroidales bacterium]|nr:hypothetical protein [Bacteroidales bacterium]